MISSKRDPRLLFRQVNEQIRRVHAGFALDSAVLDLICECRRLDCVERITVPAQVYEDVRLVDGTFLVAPSHEHADEEQVTACEGTHDVVASRPAARRSAGAGSHAQQATSVPAAAAR